MSEYTFVAETRENLGKGASRRLRKENKIPAIVYGGAKNRKPQSITLASNVVAKAEKNEDFYSSVSLENLQFEVQCHRSSHC